MLSAFDFARAYKSAIRLDCQYQNQDRNRYLVITTFTLDTNCIIALESDEAAAPAIRSLVAAHRAGRADVAVVGISASERQKSGKQLENFAEFQKRLADLGLGDLQILRPLLYFDITYWDWSVLSGDQLSALERKIHDALFPGAPFSWSEFCAAVDADESLRPGGSPWGNRKCDVLAVWSHIHAARDAFVTDDRNFHSPIKMAQLIALGAGRIETASSAALLL